MMIVILINSAMVGLSTFKVINTIHPSMQNPCVEEGFIEFMEWVFFVIYLVEFVIKFTARPAGYWNEYFNVFDFVLLVLSIAERFGPNIMPYYNRFYYKLPLTKFVGYQGFPDARSSPCRYKHELQWLGTRKWLTTRIGDIGLPQDSITSDTGAGGGSASSMKIFRCFRALRALRALRTIRYFRNLNVLLHAIISTVANYIFPVMLTVLMLIVILGVIGHNMFSQSTGEFDYIGDAKSYWVSLYDSIRSLAIVFTVDGWYDIFQQFKAYPESEYFTPNYYLIICLIILHFVLFNIFVGINISNIQEANSEYYSEILAEKEANLTKKKNDILERQFEDVRKLKDKQRLYQGAGGTGGFYDMISGFRETLRHDDYVVGDNPVSDLDWIELELDTLDAMDDQMYRVQQLLFENAHIMSIMADEALKRKILGGGVTGSLAAETSETGTFTSK